MAWVTPPTLRFSASSFVSKLVWNHWILMQTANVAPLRGTTLLAFRGAVNFSLLDLCFDMVEVGGSNPPGPTKFSGLCFFSTFFSEPCVFAHEHYRVKVVTSLTSALQR